MKKTENVLAEIREIVAASPPTGDVGELIKQLRQADPWGAPATRRALEAAADALTAQAAKLAELERERDEAQHLLAHTREWDTQWLLKNKERVEAATARAERLEAALSDEMLAEIKRTIPIKPEVADAIFYRLRHDAALSPAPSLEARVRPAMIDDERAVLERLALGDAIAFSQDGDTAWFIKGDRAMVGDCIISLRAKGFVKRCRDDEGNYRGLGDLDVISDAGRAMLAAPNKGGDDAKPRTKTVCHAPGDRCRGCAHYFGNADFCEYGNADLYEPAPHQEGK